VTITVEYFAQARLIAGSATETIALDGSLTLLELVRELTRRHPQLASLLLPGGQLSRSVLFAIGERQIGPGENVALSDGDRVLIVPPISGGAR
jgi:MoaD family protein